MADLFKDRGLRAVGHSSGELKAADDGAGVHDERVGGVGGEALTGELVGVFVLGEVDLQSGETFGLDAEHHDDLGLAEGGFEVALDGDTGAGVGGRVGQELGGSAEDDARAEAGKQKHVGAGDAAVEDVAHDGDGDAGESGGRYRGSCDCACDASFTQDDGLRSRIEMIEDGAEVEQGLRGVFVHPVSRIEDWQACDFFEEPCSAGGVVAEDDGFGAERAQSKAGVLEGLAFLNARGEAGNEGGVSTKAFGGELEAGTGAGRGLVEEQGDAALEEDAVARERVLVLKSSGARQQIADGLDVEIHDREQGAGIVRK